jgi:hypothetical protein
MLRRAAPVVFLVGFLTAGLYKLETVFRSLPDLTVLFATLTLLACAAVLFRSFTFPRSMGVVLAFFGCLIPGVIDMGTSYGGTKVSQTFTLGLLACLAPLFLLRSRRSFVVFFWLMSGMGALLAVLSLFGFNNPSQYGRFSALQTTTIAEARIVGFALICIVLATLDRRIHWVVGLSAGGVLAYAMVATGSRGPLLALLASSLAVVLFARQGMGRRILSSGQLAILAILVGLLYFAYLTAPFYSQARLLSIGDSGSVRLVAWRATFLAIPLHPLGIGWGNWAPFVGSTVSQGQLLYPHDLILEVFLEGGWIAGIAMIAFFVYVGRRAFRQATDLMGRVVLALWLFYLVNSLLSDDLVGARVLLAMCGVVLASYAGKRRSHATALEFGAPSRPEDEVLWPGVHQTALY